MRISLLSGICILLILLNIFFEDALGVSPGRRLINYDFNNQIETYINIHNSDGKEKFVSIMIKGELAPYINIENNEIHFIEGETIKKIPLVINTPLDITPGRKEAVLEISEKPEFLETESGTLINARLQVLSFIILDVPVEGKYMDLNVDITPSETETKFLATILNQGETVEKGMLTIRVYKNNLLVQEFKSNAFSLSMGEKKNFEFRKSFDEGEYKLISILDYDGEQSKLERIFNIEFGKLLEITSIDVKEFKLGEIANFVIGAKNFGKSNIDDLYAIIEIYDDNGIIAEVKSNTIEINPNDQSFINLYWDTKDIVEGKYKSVIKLLYGGRDLKKDIEITVEKDKIIVNSLTGGFLVSKDISNAKKLSVVILIFILVIIINIILLIKHRKRKKRLDLN